MPVREEERDSDTMRGDPDVGGPSGWGETAVVTGLSCLINAVVSS